jgi:hypothetical protein
VAEGVVPEASWFPVTIEVHNDGPSFTGVIELSSGQMGQGQSRVLVMELPNGTRKREILPVYSASRYSGAWDVRLRDEKGRLRAERLNLKPRKLTPRESIIFAALTRTVGGMPIMPDTKANRSDFQPATARLLPELFPENPLVLQGLDALYLHSEKALDLKVNQVSALIAWLHAGGHLIVGVEQPAQINGNPWLRNVLPCEITGVTTAKASEVLQNWLRQPPSKPSLSEALRPDFSQGPRRPPNPNRPAPTGTNPFATILDDETFESGDLQVATLTLHEGKVVVGSPETPLIISAGRGRGKITVLTFSPELEPFRSWKNRSWFWARLINVPPEAFGESEFVRQSGANVDGVFGAMIDTKQIRKMPVAWLLLLLVGYLLVIGPFDQYWLKKLNKQMLTWLTFPAYVAVFSGLIYVIGFYLRAGETEWNELHVVDVIPLGPRADLTGRTYASIYSPVNAKYDVQSDQPFATLRGEFQGWNGGQESTKALVEQRGNSFRAEVSVPVWVSQVYVSDWWRQSPSPLNLTVTADANHLQVTIENRLDRQLTGAKLAFDGKIFDLGAVPAKQTKTFSLDRAAGTSLKNFVDGYASLFQVAVQQRQRAFGSGDSGQISDIAQGSMAASFVSLMANDQYRSFNYPAGLDLAPLIERGEAVLLAWAPDYAPVPPINKFSPRRTHRDTLLRVAVPMK